MLLEQLQPRPRESLLDVGCGTGFFTRALASEISGPVTGVDINPEWVDFARRRNPVKASYEIADARALPYEDASFDLVVSIAALCFIKEEHSAVSEMLRVVRRCVAIGLLNRRSLLWLRKGWTGGRGRCRGAHWHTVGEAEDLFREFPVQQLRIRTGVHIPGGGRFARVVERLWPQRLHTGAFILIVADVAEPEQAPPNSGAQRTALRAAADAMS